MVFSRVNTSKISILKKKRFLKHLIILLGNRILVTINIIIEIKFPRERSGLFLL